MIRLLARAPILRRYEPARIDSRALASLDCLGVPGILQTPRSRRCGAQVLLIRLWPNWPQRGSLGLSAVRSHPTPLARRGASAVELARPSRALSIAEGCARLGVAAGDRSRIVVLSRR